MDGDLRNIRDMKKNNSFFSGGIYSDISRDVRVEEDQAIVMSYEEENIRQIFLFSKGCWCGS